MNRLELCRAETGGKVSRLRFTWLPAVELRNRKGAAIDLLLLPLFLFLFPLQEETKKSDGEPSNTGRGCDYELSEMDC